MNKQEVDELRHALEEMRKTMEHVNALTVSLEPEMDMLKFQLLLIREVLKHALKDLENNDIPRATKRINAVLKMIGEPVNDQG